MEKKKRKLKSKVCKWCKKTFEPTKPLQSVCSPNCAIQKIRHENRIKQERKRNEELKVERAEIRQRKLSVKPRSHWMNKAQAAVNKFIRARDKDLPCISCGTTTTAQWDAGHYRTTASAPQLRFDEDNIHKQCVVCNQHKSGNLVPYRVELIKRIGLERTEALESNHKNRKYTVDELKAIEQQYKDKLKNMEQ
ncbi:recombination protein NinG [Thorsellia kenyensis]|uniref:Recombination protein NinG n=1 Tax=Thorsellia kenyensis TaxID=1549888 RepID=A0ABV6C7R2_9GAMM